MGLAGTTVSASPRSMPQIETVRFGIAPTYPVNYGSPYEDSAPFITSELDGINGPDLITANTDSMLVLLNQGNGTFGAAVGFGMGLRLSDLALADLDGDGRVDAIAAGSDSVGPVLVVRKGLPGPDFGPVQRRDLGAVPSGIAAGDMDGDGHVDVVMVSVAEESLWVVRNDGTGALSSIASVFLPTGAGSIVLADLNEDGRLDVVTLKSPLYRSTPDSGVCVLMNRGGPAPEVSAFYSATELPTGVAAVRSDPQSHMDLAILTNRHVFLMRGPGDGSFANPDSLFRIAWAHAHTPRSIQPGDIDGDGWPDLVFLNLQTDGWGEGNYVAIARGLGAGEFAMPRRYHTPARPDRMLVSDLDHDGALDIAVLAGDAACCVGDPILPGVTVYRSFDGGRMPGALEVEFDPGRSQQADFPGAIESGRLRAGRPRDLIVTDGGWTFVLRNKGRDEFAGPIDVGPGRLSAVADLDRDGLDDLVLAGHDSTRVWRSLGDGGFEMTGEYVGGVWIGLGDLDGDGRDDLALRAQGDQLAIRRGNGNATFGDVDPRGLALRPEATAFLIKDLDHDGLADVACGLGLATQGSPEDTLTMSLNLGNGGWNDPIAVGLPQPDGDYGPPRFIAAGDMDRDGRLDLVVLQTVGVGSDSYGFFNVVHSDAGGAYSCSGFDDPSNSPTDLHIADLNRDGFPEALTVNSNGGLTFHFYFYENDGHGFLLPWERYRVTDFSTNVTAADLDDDGLLDIATYTPRYGSLTIVRNVSVPQLPTAVLVSLVSCTTDAGVVRLEWYGAREVSGVAVQRRSSSSAAWTQIASLSPDALGFVRYEDRSVLPGARYAYRLEVGGSAGGMLTAESWVDVPALAVQLRGVRPNPFRSNAIVGFSLPAPATASLEVLDVAGRKVREQRVEGLPAGEHLVRLDSNGAPLRPGVYLIRLNNLGQARTTRAIVVE
jgi:hypothetical protein